MVELGAIGGAIVFMDVLRIVFLLLATVSMGLVAGIFDVYRHAIMPGLAKTDDRTFVGAFQQMDIAIINPWFMVTEFLGALVLTGIAGALQIGRAPFWWIAAAFVLYLITVVITVTVNVPLNDALRAAGAPDTLRDLAGVRARFNEARWRAFNRYRVFATIVPTLLLAWALVVQGQTG